MKKLVCAVAVAVLAGCGGLGQKEVEDLVKKENDQLESRLKARLAEEAAALDRKITDTNNKFAGVLAMDQNVKNGLQKIDTHAKLLEGANERLLKILRAQLNALNEQMQTVKDQISALEGK